MSNVSTMETVLFGQGHLSIKYGTVRTRLAIAATIYKVCKHVQTDSSYDLFALFSD